MNLDAALAMADAGRLYPSVILHGGEVGDRHQAVLALARRLLCEAPGSDDQMRPLPTDDELLRSWEAHETDRCLEPRRAKPKQEKHVATHRLMLQSVTANGAPVRDVSGYRTDQQVTFVAERSRLSRHCGCGNRGAR